LIEEKLAFIAVLVGLYLADCVVFLHPTQALGTILIPWRFDRILTPWRKRPCSAPLSARITLNFGMTFYPTRGYFPALLNPLTPSITIFRTATFIVSLNRPKDSHPLALHRLIAARLIVRSFAPMIVLHALLLFGVMPLHLLYGRIEQLLITLGVDFLVAGSIIGLSYPLVRMLRLKRGAYWSLAVQCLVCLPLSLNFPRKLALTAASKADAEQLMPRLPAHSRWPVTQDFITVLDFARNGPVEPGEATRAAMLVDRLRMEMADE
jgi:hypothetical protein